MYALVVVAQLKINQYCTLGADVHFPPPKPQ
jgi:hypothetical protein